MARLMTSRVPNAAICLLSALRFHELITQNPHEVWIAIGPKDRKPVLESPALKVALYGAARFSLGLEGHQVEGARLRVYSHTRTVLGLFLYQNNGMVWCLRRSKKVGVQAGSCWRISTGSPDFAGWSGWSLPYLESLTV